MMQKHGHSFHPEIEIAIMTDKKRPGIIHSAIIAKMILTPKFPELFVSL